MHDRFKTFIVVSLAIAITLGGWSFASLESTSSRQRHELQQEQLNNCKLKLYDLAVGYEARAVHANPRSPQYNPRQAAVLAGALRVVQSIPSSQSCIPQVRSAIEHTRVHGTEKLPASVERELIRLAALPNPGSSNIHQNAAHPVTPRPNVHRSHRNPRHAPHGGTGGSGGGSSGGGSSVPPIIVTVPVPAPSHPTHPEHPSHSEPPKVETPPVVVPPVEVPPITVETSPVKLPCVQVGPVKANCTEEN